LSQKHRVAAALAVLLVLGTLWLVLPEQYRGRLETVDNLNDDASYQGRVKAWGLAWDMFKQNPVTGVGVGNFAIVHGTSSGHWLNVHSLYFQLLSEMGLVGVISFAVFVGSVFRQNWLLLRQSKRIPNCPAWFRHYPLACNIAFLGLLLAGYSSHNLGRDTWYFLAALSAAAGLVVKRETAALERKNEDKATVSADSSVGLAEAGA